MNNREGDTMKTLLFVFALTLSACGEEEATETEATSTTPVEQVEVQTTENVENGVEEEYVTLGELRRYIVSSEIPFDLVVLQKEADNIQLIDFKWKDENKELCLIYDINY